jgi:hypothetical protein
MDTRIKVLVPRRSPEERVKNWQIATNKKIQEYIKNGSKGNLDLSNTPITSLPDNLTRVGGSLDLQNTKITSLPNNLTVEGSLYLRYTPIVNLPNNLTINRSAEFSWTSIASLPEDLKIGGSLFLFYTPLSQMYTKPQIKLMVPNIKEWEGNSVYF